MNLVTTGPRTNTLHESRDADTSWCNRTARYTPTTRQTENANHCKACPRNREKAAATAQKNADLAAAIAKIESDPEYTARRAEWNRTTDAAATHARTTAEARTITTAPDGTLTIGGLTYTVTGTGRALTVHDAAGRTIAHVSGGEHSVHNAVTVHRCALPADPAAARAVVATDRPCGPATHVAVALGITGQALTVLVCACGTAHTGEKSGPSFNTLAHVLDDMVWGSPIMFGVYDFNRSASWDRVNEYVQIRPVHKITTETENTPLAMDDNRAPAPEVVHPAENTEVTALPEADQNRRPAPEVVHYTVGDLVREEETGEVAEVIAADGPNLTVTFSMRDGSTPTCRADAGDFRPFGRILAAPPADAPTPPPALRPRPGVKHTTPSAAATPAPRPGETVDQYLHAHAEEVAAGSTLREYLRLHHRHAAAVIGGAPMDSVDAHRIGAAITALRAAGVPRRPAIRSMSLLVAAAKHAGRGPAVAGYRNGQPPA